MLSFDWCVAVDSNEQITHKVISTKFGDGYEQISSQGINNKRKSWSCSMKQPKATIDEVVAFLDATKGVTPFYFKPLPDEPRITVRLDGGISRVRLGANIWQISFNLKQVFIS